MENIIHAMIYINETKALFKREFEAETTLWNELEWEYFLNFIEVILEIVYVAIIVKNKGISLSDFFVTVYCGICSTYTISKAWTIYQNVYKSKKIKNKMKLM